MDFGGLAQLLSVPAGVIAAIGLVFRDRSHLRSVERVMALDKIEVHDPRVRRRLSELQAQVVTDAHDKRRWPDFFWVLMLGFAIAIGCLIAHQIFRQIPTLEPFAEYWVPGALIGGLVEGFGGVMGLLSTYFRIRHYRQRVRDAKRRYRLELRRRAELSREPRPVSTASIEPPRSSDRRQRLRAARRRQGTN